MKKKLISIAIASVLVISSGQLLADQYDEDSTTDDQGYTAIGIGATSGALMAGPAGLIIGGFLGSLYGRGEAEDELQDMEFVAESEADALVEAPMHDEAEDLILASTSKDIPQIDSGLSEEKNRIKEIVTNDLSIAVYFKPGSVNFESFYTQQFLTISNLLHEMPEMELNLEGYSDRQGNQSDNLQLSAERLESVRDYFVNSGIDPNRIKVRAYGEKNFLSTPGELESYVFDRRVVVSFRESTKNLQNNIAVVKEASSL